MLRFARNDEKYMKLISWNIGGAFPLISRTKEWSRNDYAQENIEAFIPPLQRDNADVICLQEIHAESLTGSQQAATLSEALHMKPSQIYSYNNDSHIKPGSHLAMVTLSKQTIKKSTIQKPPNPNLSVTRPNGAIWRTLDCGFLISEVEYKGQTIYVVNGHLVPFHYYGRNFSESSFDFIREAITNILVPLSNRPTIIGADFNIDGLEKLIPGLFPTFTEIFHEDTTPTRGQQDHILVSKHWGVVDYEVEKSISDHYLCSVNLQLT